MISVVVPYRDSSDYLDRCCQSLMQLPEGYEFVMVDDNHDPETIGLDESVVIKYAEFDERFKVYTNELTPGVSGARNTGIDYALGDWITFLDADDELLPGADKAFWRALKADANVHQINHKRYIQQKGCSMASLFCFLSSTVKYHFSSLYYINSFLRICESLTMNIIY